MVLSADLILHDSLDLSYSVDESKHTVSWQIVSVDTPSVSMLEELLRSRDSSNTQQTQYC